MTLPEDLATDSAAQHRPRAPLPPDTARQPIDHGHSGTAELTALAAHLRRLSNQVEELTAAHATLTTGVRTTLEPELAALRQDSTEQLAIHAAQIRQLHATNTAEHHPPINWPALTTEQATIEWEQLADWIADIFVPWYEITREQLPDCWALHRPAVIELSWLHATHQEAFAPNAGAHQAADWHTRWRPAVLHRLHEIIPRRGARYCGPSRHLVDQDHRLPSLTTPPSADARMPAARQPMPNEQLAERHHWVRSYHQAVTEDRSWRQSRQNLSGLA